MKLKSTVVEAAASYVSKRMKAELPTSFSYHNLDHTIAVVKATEAICEALNLGGRSRKRLQVAAWFHDFGYITTTENHEANGAAAAEEFLREREIDAEAIEEIKSLILATRYPQVPKTVNEQIICDADMLHLGAPGYRGRTELLRSEWAATRNRTFTDAEWYKQNIRFLKDHRFHTSFAVHHCSPKVAEEIQKFKELRKEAEPLTDESKGKEEKDQKIVKGADTLFKNASRNHMELSAMADNKAHILLSICSLIISVILSLSVQRTADSLLVIPGALLLLVCLTTMVLAVLTTKPKISKGVFTLDQIRKHEVNLLFFGNFHRMDLATYENGVRELMGDKQYLFTSMTRDVYYLGKVLAVKYRYLRISYKVFMYGLIASVAAMACVLLIANPA